MSGPLGIIVNQNSDASAIDSWALVLNGILQNVISGNLAFIQSIQASYDYLVDISVGGQSDVNQGFAYNSESNTFSAPIPSLQTAQMQNLQAFNAALQSYTDSIFTLQTQFRFFILYYLAIQNGLTNRAAYIAPLFTWADSVSAFAGLYVASVMSQSDAATALNSQWNFGNIPQAPTITLLGAIQILT